MPGLNQELGLPPKAVRLRLQLASPVISVPLLVNISHVTSILTSDWSIPELLLQSEVGVTLRGGGGMSHLLHQPH